MEFFPFSALEFLAQHPPCLTTGSTSGSSTANRRSLWVCAGLVFLFLRCSGRKKQEAADESLSSENRSQPSAAFSHRVCSWKYPPRAAEHVQTAPITDNTNFNSAPTTQALTCSVPARKLSLCKICEATSEINKKKKKKNVQQKAGSGENLPSFSSVNTVYCR